MHSCIDNYLNKLICETFGDSVEHIDVLGFHQLGRPKWHELRIPYPLENQKGPNAATRERVAKQFKDRSFDGMYR